MKTSRPLPLKLKNHFYRITGVAIANKRYRWAINAVEKYTKQYYLSDNEKYRLALLYDHLAMKIKQKIKNRGRQAKLLNKYLKRATELYREILKANPRYLHANYGLGRVYGIKGDINKAIKYQIRAYQQMLKLPRNQRGALVIGALYEKKGDLKNAEKWYLKEYQDCRKNDFGTVYNLFLFYKTHKNYKKASLYVKKVKRLLEEEYKKKIYRGLRMKDSSFINHIKREIDGLERKEGAAV